MADARTQRWVQHRTDERARIVDVAATALEEIGPGVTMNAIAARAGVPKPTLYRYFTDKSGLMTAVAERARANVIAEVLGTGGDSPRTFGDLLHASLTAYASLLSRYPNVSRHLFYGADTAGTHTTANSREVATRIEPLIAAAITASGSASEPQDVSLLACLIVGTVTGGAAWWLESAGAALDPAAFVDDVMPAVSAVVAATARRRGLSVDLTATVPQEWRVS